AEANEQLVEKYRFVQRVRLGAELTLPGTATQLRVGYFRDPSPLKQANVINDKEFFSAGVGLLLDKQVKLDVAYVHGKWQENNAGLNNFVTRLTEDITVNKVFATLSFRL
ncbi:MAG: hypothetical protein D6814_09935, partial [Calditrichaeota bacterium]